MNDEVMSYHRNIIWGLIIMIKSLGIGTLRRHSQVYIDQPNKFRW